MSHEALFAELKSELISAYVDAVIVPSKPERKAFDQSAVSTYQFPQVTPAVLGDQATYQLQ